MSEVHQPSWPGPATGPRPAADVNAAAMLSSAWLSPSSPGPWLPLQSASDCLCSSTCSTQSLIQPDTEHISPAQPQVGLGSLHLGGVGVEAAEQLFRHAEGEDVHTLVTRRSLGASPLFHWLYQHCSATACSYSLALRFPPTTLDRVNAEEPTLGCGHTPCHSLGGTRQRPHWPVVPLLVRNQYRRQQGT